MLFNYLLTNTPQIFADVRTYWSPEAVERVTGHKLEVNAENGFLHLSTLVHVHLMEQVKLQETVNQ